jgi:hypothetical protein
MKDPAILPLVTPEARSFPIHSNATPRSVRRIILLLMLLIVSSASLLSQQFASVNLTTVDPAGGVIAVAAVSVRNVDTGVVRSSVSDKLGLVVIPGLPAGQYKITANAQGFATSEMPITLTLGQTASLQIPLRVRGALNK